MCSQLFQKFDYKQPAAEVVTTFMTGLLQEKTFLGEKL